MVLRNGHRLRPPLPRHLRPGLLRRRARPALGRLPARLRAAAAASTSITRTTAATSGSTNSTAARQTRAARRLAPHRDRDPPPDNSNHNGGQLQFLGNLLYFGTGDGGSGGDPPNNAQNKESLLGKLLRIDPRPSGGRPYSVPASNPFVGRAGRDEIYSYGLRNPFRFSFDTVTARAPRIAIGDVGQNRFEEVDYTTVAAAAGANFGWDAFEGFAPYRDENSGTPDPGGTVKPIFAYPHSRGGCSIIGGYVVADRGLPSLYGRYVYTDYCDGALRSLVPHLSRAGGDRKLGLSVAGTGLLRRRRPRPPLRHLPGRPRLPPRLAAAPTDAARQFG